MMDPADLHRIARRHVLALAALPFSTAATPHVRPGPSGWPEAAAWETLRARTGDALQAVASPWPACRADPGTPACAALLARPQNPYAIGDDVARTQTYGWVDAWTSEPPAYALSARGAADVAAAVDFARTHRLRLVVRGGGHSYKGQSNAADALLVWTRRLRSAALHEAFVPAGCDLAPRRAVSLGAGVLWNQAYDVVTTHGGGYVQGGGCMTVGVPGLVQMGGFGSFSKAYGLAASSLLEAELVTADGQLRTVNACREPELFWALKGGGAGFGIVTCMTLAVHALPERFGAVNFTLRAASDAAFRRLIDQVLDFCAQHLITPHWGEQIRLRRGNVLQVAMVFQGLDRAQAQAVWAPFFAAVDAAGADYALEFSLLRFVSVPAQEFWAPSLMKRALGLVARDERPGAPETNLFWPGDQAQAGQVLHAYQSGWLDATLLQPGARAALAEGLYAATRHAGVSLHLNKGLAGATDGVLAAARETAVHPAALTAFALLICGAEQGPAYPGVPGHAPDVPLARSRRAALARALQALRAHVPVPAAYVAESDYFEDDWPQRYWGPHYARLLAVKRRVDPEGLFTHHHGVGSAS